MNRARPALQHILTEILEAKNELELENRPPVKVRLRPSPKWPHLNIANPGKVVDATLQLLVTVQVPVCRTNVWWERVGARFKVELKPDPQGNPRWFCSCGAEKFVCDHVSDARRLHERMACRWNHMMDPSAEPAPATVYKIKPHCPECGGALEFKSLMLYKSLYEIDEEPDAAEIDEEPDATEPARIVEAISSLAAPFGPVIPDMKRGFLKNELRKSGTALGEKYASFHSWGLPYPLAGREGWVTGFITKKKGVKQYRVTVSSWSALPGAPADPQGRPKTASGPLGPHARNRRWNSLQGAKKFILNAMYQEAAG